MNKLDLAYMAGVFDGEGTVTYHTSTSEKITIKIAVYNSDVTILQPFLDFFGGTIHHNTDKRCKNLSMWQLPKAEVSKFCTTMLKFCREKKKLAKMKLALEFLSTNQSVPGEHLTEDSKQLQNKFREEYNNIVSYMPT